VHVLLVGGALFGEHAYEASLRAYVREHGLTERVHFLGQSRDVAALMQCVDLIVHPSTAPEPFARTLIEAMLSGRAPIAAANGGVPELISDGHTGYLFLPGDALALRRVVARLLRAPEEVASVGAAARERARRDFSLATFVANTEAHLRAAAEARREGAWGRSTRAVRA
jgi:glycosyltransferase involved in cell wall biosynthesis